MNSHIVGWLAAGVALATGVGALIWYLKRRGARAKDGPTPSNPPRMPPKDGGEGDDIYEDATPDSEKDSPDKSKYRPAFDFLNRESLPAALVESIDEAFGEGWAVNDEVIDDLEPDSVVLFAVESEPTGPYKKPVEEVISARVLAVENEVVRARVMGPVKHSEHFGTTAGHGLREGMAVDVPRSAILVAASEARPEGYGGRGKAAATFKPTSTTKDTYLIQPGTPYDLRMPYRTEDLEWYVEPKAAKLMKIGEDGLLEQIMFSEDSLRGEVTVRAIDNDPKAGKVLVGRWEFKLSN